MAAIIAGLRKPTVAYVGSLGASAAYYLAAAAQEVVVAKDAMVGFIGTVATLFVQEDPDRDGYREFEILSSHAPNKRPDPRTEGGLAELQRQVDAFEQIFIADVARYRDVSVATVRNDFGRGGILIGAAAVAAGMADRVGSFEQALADLSGDRAPAGTPARAMPANTISPKTQPTKGVPQMPAQTTTNAHLSHEARGEAEWNANPALREAFHRGGLSGYTAYAKAVESGRARQVGHDLKAELAALRGA